MDHLGVLIQLAHLFRLLQLHVSLCSKGQQSKLATLLVYSTEYPGSLVPNPLGGSVKNVIKQRPVATRSPGATHFTAASHATAIMLPSQHVACQVSTFYGPAPSSTTLHSRVSGSQASAVSGSDFSHECQQPQ